MHLMALLAAVTGQPLAEAVPELPTDPLQRCAHRALRGDFGRIHQWQGDGYRAAIASGATVQGTAWVTSYYPSEGFVEGQCTRSGNGVSLRSAAVRRADWRQRRGQYIWTAAYGIRIVEDTGADRNQRIAQRRGAEIWLDYWFRGPKRGNPVTPYAFIARGGGGGE